MIGKDRFFESYLSCPVEVCRRRDDTGAYAQADTGKIASFPGVSAAFEAPTHPDLVLATDQMEVEEEVEMILKLLAARKILG